VLENHLGRRITLEDEVGFHRDRFPLCSGHRQGGQGLFDSPGEGLTSEETATARHGMEKATRALKIREADGDFCRSRNCLMRTCLGVAIGHGQGLLRCYYWIRESRAHCRGSVWGVSTLASIIIFLNNTRSIGLTYFVEDMIVIVNAASYPRRPQISKSLHSIPKDSASRAPSSTA
jgi:hypothetical protein